MKSLVKFLVSCFEEKATDTANMLDNNKVQIATVIVAPAVLGVFVNNVIAKKCAKKGYKKTATVFRLLNVYGVAVNSIYLCMALKVADNNTKVEVTDKE